MRLLFMSLNLLFVNTGDFALWSDNQPNNIGGVQYCGVVDKDVNYRMADEACDGYNAYVCDIRTFSIALVFLNSLAVSIKHKVKMRKNACKFDWEVCSQLLYVGRRWWAPTFCIRIWRAYTKPYTIFTDRQTYCAKKWRDLLQRFANTHETARSNLLQHQR